MAPPPAAAAWGAARGAAWSRGDVVLGERGDRREGTDTRRRRRARARPSAGAEGAGGASAGRRRRPRPRRGALREVGRGGVRARVRFGDQPSACEPPGTSCSSMRPWRRHDVASNQVRGGQTTSASVGGRWPVPHRRARERLPAVEAHGARERVELPRPRARRLVLAMVSPVVEHVRQAVPHLARRAQDPRVIAVREHRAVAALAGARADHVVDVPRRRDQEPLHPVRQRAPVLGLDDQVQVRALHAQVHDPERLELQHRERRLADRQIHVARAQRADARHHARHDMHRLARAQLRPALVPLARPRPLRRSPGARALAAVGAEPHRGLDVSLAFPRHDHSIARPILISPFFIQTPSDVHPVKARALTGIMYISHPSTSQRPAPWTRAAAPLGARAACACSTASGRARSPPSPHPGSCRAPPSSPSSPAPLSPPCLRLPRLSLSLFPRGRSAPRRGRKRRRPRALAPPAPSSTASGGARVLLPRHCTVRFAFVSLRAPRHEASYVTIGRCTPAARASGTGTRSSKPVANTLPSSR